MISAHRRLVVIKQPTELADICRARHHANVSTAAEADVSHSYPRYENEFRIATVPGSERRLYVCPTVEHAIGARRCIFCDGALTGNRSREHVFPRWLTRHYGAATKSFQLAWTADWSGELRSQRDLTFDGFVAGRICRTCNNGWMSTLESDVSQLLIQVAECSVPLAELAMSDRQLLARWAAKTAFALRVADLGPDVVEPGQPNPLVHGEMPDVAVVARQAPVDLGLSCYTTQWWMITYPRNAFSRCTELVGRSHKTIVTVGHLILAICFWPDPRWHLLVSSQSHTPLWPLDRAWLTYPYRTDRHGAEPNRHTETIDMVVGTRIVHPARAGSFAPIAADGF